MVVNMKNTIRKEIQLDLFPRELYDERKARKRHKKTPESVERSSSGGIQKEINKYS